MSFRNREQGWQYAKLSGHENEVRIAEELRDNMDFRLDLLRRIGQPNDNILDISFGGLHEKSVLSIFQDWTKPKADLSLLLEQQGRINFSIKKSFGGQVFLISKERFILGFEAIFQTTIPKEVKHTINLFWSNPQDDSLKNIINNYGNKFKNYELRKNRLTADTLYNYNSFYFEILLEWFKENIDKLTIFCFKTGLSSVETSYSQFLWFKNLVDSNIFLDEIYDINFLAFKAKKYASLINYGTRNGGTTIVLPFGSVQWHQGCLQFRYDLNSIRFIYCN